MSMELCAGRRLSAVEKKFREGLPRVVDGVSESREPPFVLRRADECRRHLDAAEGPWFAMPADLGCSAVRVPAQAGGSSILPWRIRPRSS